MMGFLWWLRRLGDWPVGQRGLWLDSRDPRPGLMVRQPSRLGLRAAGGPRIAPRRHLGRGELYFPVLPAVSLLGAGRRLWAPAGGRPTRRFRGALALFLAWPLIALLARLAWAGGAFAGVAARTWTLHAAFALGVSLWVINLGYGFSGTATRRLPRLENVLTLPRLENVLTDGIYNGGIAEWAQEVGGWSLEMVVRPEGWRISRS